MEAKEIIFGTRDGKEYTEERFLTEEEIAEIKSWSQEEADRKTLLKLELWFEHYFRKQLEQSLWQNDFSVSHDDYFDKDYASFDELKIQATLVRNKIRGLKEKLKIQG